MFSHTRTSSTFAAPEVAGAATEVTTYRRGEVICHQGYVANYWYSVTRGAATRSVIRSDGRRVLLELLLPGDFFGFALQGEYDSSSEAVVDGTVIVRYSRLLAEERLRSNPTEAWAVCEALIGALSRLERHLLVGGRVTASQKVGSFLFEVERRVHGPANELQLPLSRYDIADYLGISVETVSRALSDLVRRGCIQLTGPRGVRILDRDALE